MCGIVGCYSKCQIHSDDLKSMAGILKHRGPDAEGIFIHHHLGFAHQRLSIIDLSEVANQPMISRSGNSVIIYNGEVYNFKELKSKIGIDFRSSSDTEVLLEGFEKWGPDFVNQLNGMFAIAFYDLKKDILYLFRDRIGIKPLFFSIDQQGLAFASELKALLCLPSIKKNLEMDMGAVRDFLHLGYVPEPATIFRNVKKFPAGHYMKYDGNSTEILPYWNICNHISANYLEDEQSLKSSLKDLIRSSVKYRLISDVPFGIFLSGGIDSSTVTAVANEISDSRLKTFTIGFKESKYDESRYARKISEYLGTEHHEMIVEEKEALELIMDIIDVYDEPFADSSAIPTMLVSKLARKHITMVLSGDGGDELFWGYGAYRWARRLTNPCIRTFHKPIAHTLSMLSNRAKRAARLFDYSYGDITSHIFSQEQYLFSADEVLQILVGGSLSERKYHMDAGNLPRSLTATEQQSLFDLKYYLKDDLLVKVDRASMRYALETRVPLLDHRIVEFAVNVHPKLKIRNGKMKHLLKMVLYDYIPEEYFTRPKWGFAIPLQQWLKQDLKYLIDNYLSEDIIKYYNIVCYSVVEDLKRNYLSKNLNYLYNRIWALIVLHMFVDKMKISLPNNNIR